MTDMTVSRTILEQLGGARFARMTGAKNFTGDANSLTFRLPGAGGFCKQGINLVTIRLNAFDTYDVEFLKIRGTNSAVKGYREGIYAEQLQAVFTQETGLSTNFGQGRE